MSGRTCKGRRGRRALGPGGCGAASGFTLIELLVVLAIVALLSTIAVPKYIDHVERARETALKTDLKVMREAIDKFEADQGHLPKDLDELVTRRYLKSIPIDPITDRRDSWVPVGALESALDSDARGSSATGDGSAPDSQSDGAHDAGLADVRSGAKGNGRDGTPFAIW